MSNCELLELPIHQHRVLKERTVPDQGWVQVETHTSQAGGIAQEDEEIWALVTEMWDRDDMPEEGQVRKLP